MKNKKTLQVITLSLVLLLLFLTGCKKEIVIDEQQFEELCKRWIVSNEACAPEDITNPIAAIQKTTECQEEVNEKLGVNNLEEKEKRKFLTYCMEKQSDKRLEQLKEEDPGMYQEFKTASETMKKQQKEYEEQQQINTPKCKKYLPSIKQFCPRAIEAEPHYISYENPQGVFAILLQGTQHAKIEGCSWRVDIGANPLTSTNPLETNSLVVSVELYKTVEEATTYFTERTNNKKSMITHLENCEGEVKNEFYSSSCSTKLNSPENKGKITHSLEASKRERDLIIYASSHFGEEAIPVCDIEELKKLVESI